MVDWHFKQLNKLVKLNLTSFLWNKGHGKETSYGKTVLFDNRFVDCWAF